MKPLSKLGVGVWNVVTQTEAATISQAIYTKEIDGVDSDLINSFAWDTALDYIQKCGILSPDYANTCGYSKIDTSKPQTTGTNVLRATNAVDEACKIFDMAGNITEWSTETCTYESVFGDSYVARGDTYVGNFYAKHRGVYDITSIGPHSRIQSNSISVT